MSLADFEPRRGPGIKGRRIPGRPGRFDPSMPLHMTTRRAAKTTTTEGTPSLNGSIEDDDYDGSRRDSTDGTRPSTSYSQPSQASPETAQLAGAADIAYTPDDRDSPQEKSTSIAGGQNGIGATNALRQSLTVPQKRKRDSGSLPQSPSEASVEPSTPLPTAPSHVTAPSDDNVFGEVDDDDPLPEEHALDDESGSDDAQDEEIAVANVSIDATPIGSAAESPASSVTDLADELHEKALDDTVDIVMQDAGADGPAETADLEDDEEGFDQLRSGDETRPLKRFGGKRRRAAHPLPKVEHALRRQLDTRKAFRSIAREVKAALAEIAQRTLDDIISNPNSYEEAKEYGHVVAGLGDALQERKATIEAQHKLDLELLKQRLHSEEQIRRAAFSLTVQIQQDDALNELQHDMLVAARKAHLEEHETAQETDDEDDVVPRPKKAAYRFKRGAAIDPAHESRSRQAMETEEAVDELRRRMMMGWMLSRLAEEDRPHDEPNFAVINSTTRDAAIAGKAEKKDMRFLAEAAAEAERRDKIPTLRNEDAYGLQLLGDLCGRPSITAPTRPPQTPTVHESHVMSSLPRPRSSPPPHPPISVEMSPRAKQIFRERYEGSMGPPPLTPRQADATFGSPFAGLRNERPRASPTVQAERTNGLPMIAARPSDATHFDGIVRAPIDKHGSRLNGPQSPRLHRHSGSTSSYERLTDQGRSLLNPETPERRTRSVDERSIFDILRRVPSLPERSQSLQTPQHEQPKPPSQSTERPPPFSPTHNRHPAFNKVRSPLHGEHAIAPVPPPAAFSGPSPQSAEERSSLAMEALGPPRSRHSSVSIKEEFRADDGQAGDNKSAFTTFRFQERPPQKHRKTNKEERGGASRRERARMRQQFEKPKERQHSTSTGSAGTPPQPGSGIFPPPLADRPTQPRPWDVPRPPHSSAPNSFAPPHGMAPPSLLSQRSLPGAPAAPPPGRNERENELPPRHRNSFPPLPSPGPWIGPLQSPFHPHPSPPQGLSQPPPPGVDRYQGRPGFGPPPPPSSLQQQQQHHHPAAPPPPPISTFGQRFVGPALAPATPDMRFHQPGFRPSPQNHPPAFAQQRNQEPPRRRTNSESHFRPSGPQGWRAYDGPGGRR
jgi:hypothetical protein